MSEFTISIEETAVKEFYVEADTAEEALNIAKNKYKNGEFVLSPGEVQLRQLSILSPESKTSGWIEF